MKKQEENFLRRSMGGQFGTEKAAKRFAVFSPEAGAFSVLIVLGGKESAKVGAEKEALNTNVRSVFEQMEQLHDGKWMWIRILDESDIDSLKLVLAAKRKPRAN